MKDSKKFVLDDPDTNFLDGLMEAMSGAENGEITTSITQMNGVDANALINYANKNDTYTPAHYTFKGRFLDGEYKDKVFEIDCSRIRCVLTVYFK